MNSAPNGPTLSLAALAARQLEGLPTAWLAFATDDAAVAVMRLQPTDPPALWASFVQGAERARLDALIAPADRARSVAAHGLARLLWAAATGYPPQAGRWVVPGSGAKPRLARVDAAAVALAQGGTGASDGGALDIGDGVGALDDLDVNVAHSGALVVCGVALGRAIGVDVEVVRPTPDLDEVARKICDPIEYAAMPPSPGSPAWLDAFYRRWVAKEAALKARGVGLAGDPQALIVDLAATTARLWPVPQPDSLPPADLALAELDVGPAARAAVVLLGAAPPRWPMTTERLAAWD